MPTDPSGSDDAHPIDAALLAAIGEDELMRRLEARCEELLQRDPAALLAVAEAAPVALLAAPRNRQLVTYYRGLGAGLRDDFAAALVIFAALLAEPGLDDAVHARALNSGALFAQVRGEDERALDWYRRSLAIWRRLGNGEREGLALLNMGILQYELQQYAEAEASVRASLERFTAAGAGHRAAMAHNELGLLARDHGRWDEALAHLGEAAAGFEREGAGDYLGRVWNNIGEVELLRGRYAEALVHFDGAIARLETRVYLVDVHVNLGLLRQARGDDAGALAAYHEALGLAGVIGRADITPLVLYRIAHAEARLGRVGDARAHLEEAMAAIEARRAPTRDEGVLVSLMGRWQLVYEAAIGLAVAAGDAAAAFDYTERARARAFADVVARAHAPDAAAVAPLDSAAARAALAPDELILAFFAAGLPGPETALLRALPPEAAGLRVCLSGEPSLYRLALSGTGVLAERCAIDPGALLSDSPFAADGRRFLRPAVLRRLYDALLAPVAGAVGAAGRVIIVPHGPLHQLPFGALSDPTGQPLLERAPRLSYAPSATLHLLGRALPPSAAPRPCLALGYNGGDGSPLRHPEAEAAAVARLCGGDLLAPGGDVATRLREAAGAYRWLHLACHGAFELGDPLRSWLAVGPGEALSAAAIMGELRLDADLVTLSACRSGVSRVLRGDEPLGLVRAFLAVGARAVLATLWEVDDHAARLLMEELYRGLRAGLAPDVALRGAQLVLRATEGGAYADASHWAAYVLISAG